MKDFKIRSEEEILQFWKRVDIYSQLSQKNKEQPKHIFYDIPYLADKLDGWKLINIILKDVMLKYKAMSGSDVYYIPTWDCYNPAIERSILKNLNKQGDNIDPVRIRELCREYVFDKINLQKELLQKMGVFGDWDNVSYAHKLRYEFKILNTLGKLLETGYLSKKVQPEYWCVRCQTALSDEEIELRQYKLSVGYVRFPVCEGLEEFGENVYFLVQVFDLWKLTASEAIAVLENCEYVIVEVAGEILIIQDECASKILNRLGYPGYRILKRIKGDILTQFTCTHPLFGTRLPVIADNITSRRFGTGLFNVASRHNPGDDKLSLKSKFNIISVVNDDGILTNEAEQFSGFSVFEVDKYITLELEKRGYLALTFPHETSCPHCWTCHTPAIFRPVEQWFFVPTNMLCERTIAALNRINWTSDLPTALAGQTSSDRQQMQVEIENLTDWPISRQRIWGRAIPVMYCENCNYQIPVAKSIKALKNSMSKKGVDAWFMPLTDDILPKDIICSRCGSKILNKDANILNNHFYSIIDFITQLISLRRRTNRRGQGFTPIGPGSLAIDIYCEQIKHVEKWLPQFVLTLSAVENKIPFVALHVNHAQLHSDSALLEGDNVFAQFASGEYCADLLRLWVILRNSEHKNIYNDIKTTLYSMLNWLVKDDKIKGHESLYASLNTDTLCPIDRLALNRLMKLISTVNSAYSNRDFMTAFNLISEFCQNELNDFYLKAVEDRLYASSVWSSTSRSAQSEFTDARSGLSVLWKMADTLVKLIAPITPFLAEQFWLNLQHLTPVPSPKAFGEGCRGEVDFSSIFLTDWPVPIRMIQQEKLERDWKQLLCFKAELTRILTEACHQGIINDFREADVVVYANTTETFEILRNYVEDVQAACSIAKLRFLQQEPENTPELFQASNFEQIFFAVRRSGI
ncbi:class I tRNA ligase family protein [Candidatus Poribacteria bacterium]|nr:class I tRNA ligase family protein [Candidatus Poribacteria bacterium]